jgi:hypothetical protein
VFVETISFFRILPCRAHSSFTDTSMGPDYFRYANEQRTFCEKRLASRFATTVQVWDRMRGVRGSVVWRSEGSSFWTGYPWNGPEPRAALRM